MIESYQADKLWNQLIQHEGDRDLVNLIELFCPTTLWSSRVNELGFGDFTLRSCRTTHSIGHELANTQSSSLSNRSVRHAYPCVSHIQDYLTRNENVGAYSGLRRQ